ncbi:MAG: carbon-nitrogen hydrolase family protein [Sulfurospirillum sp.]|nr:carbon-nitrogen hydrolase family protein [Sulfurospirillum sp.]
MKIAALQLSTLPMSSSKLDYYLRICKAKDVKLLLLNEYALNSFFKELEVTPNLMIQEQSKHKTSALKELSAKYDIYIIAPIVHVKGKYIYKSTAKFTPKSVVYYNQQFLINYKHWNEEKFFDNEIGEFNLPSFSIGGVKFGIINGFELHFDTVFSQVMKKKVDVLLCPSVSTFDSSERWIELLKMRAFTNSVYILRANRTGVYKDQNREWKFYGHSNLISPWGDEELTLGSHEEILIVEIFKDELHAARKSWSWKSALSKRGIL